MVKSYIDDAQNPRAQNKDETIRFPIGEYELLLMTLTFLSQNTTATHRIKRKILDFLNYLDSRQYEDNADVLWHLILARSVGTMVVGNNVKALPAIEARALENTEWVDYFASFFETYRLNSGHAAAGYIIENELSNEDIAYIDQYVSTRMRYMYLWSSRNVFREIADRIDADDLGDITEFNDNTMLTLERIVGQGRGSQKVSIYEGMDFTTGDDSFAAAIRTTVEARSRPSSRVKTGIRTFNEMIGGGYEGSRVYVHFGRSGDWKSGWLCSAAFWACDERFNPSFTTKDPTRKPAVLFVTMENDLFDTIERMVSFALGADVDLPGADPEKIVEMLERAFSSTTCKFIFKYRPSRSITCADLDDMIQEEYLKGYEVVMVVQDYIKRMKAVDANKNDARHIELGNVVDDMSALAKSRNIPVVTGMQMNRGAYEKFQAAVDSKDPEVMKRLGATDAGESINVYENADVVIFQGRIPVESTGDLYLVQRRAKMRGKRTVGVDLYNQPFSRDANGGLNEMRLVEDAHLPQRECAARLNIADGIAANYDADNPGQAKTLQTKQQRRQGHSASLAFKSKSPGKALPPVANASSREVPLPDDSVNGANSECPPWEDIPDQPMPNEFEGL